jgi:hypothetical protein
VSILIATIVIVGNPRDALDAANVARAFVSHVEHREFPEALQLFAEPTRKRVGRRVDTWGEELPRLSGHSMRWIRRRSSQGTYEVTFNISSDVSKRKMQVNVDRVAGRFVVTYIDPPGF